MNKQISAIAIYSEISSAIVLLDNVTAMTDSEADDLGQAELALGRARHMFASGALALFEEAPAMVAALRQVVNLAELHIAERSATPEEEEDFLSCAYLVNARAILSRIDGAGEALPQAPEPAPTASARDDLPALLSDLGAFLSGFDVCGFDGEEVESLQARIAAQVGER